MREAVRKNALFGAKVIKIVIDDQPYLYSVEDVKVLVAESARAGDSNKVAAHAATEAGVRVAAEGGVASIEHAYTASTQALQLMKKKGVYLVGTDFSRSASEAMGMADYHPKVVERLKRARAVGVQIAYGTDIVFPAPGQTRGTLSIGGIESFQEAGFTPAEILRFDDERREAARRRRSAGSDSPRPPRTSWPSRRSAGRRERAAARVLRDEGRKDRQALRRRNPTGRRAVGSPRSPAGARGRIHRPGAGRARATHHVLGRRRRRRAARR